MEWINKIHLMDCIEGMKLLEDNSIDAIVTDPPAGISFMNKEWDAFGKGNRGNSCRKTSSGNECKSQGFACDVHCDKDKKARNVFVGWLTEVFTEAKRTLKPGGHALVWALPRTSHWTATALENAGFNVKDCIYHVFGSGLPKSLNIAKAMEKKDCPDKWENNEYGGGNAKCSKCGKWIISGSPCQCPKESAVFNSPEAKRWSGWGTGLKPAVECWWLCQKPLSEPTIVKNVLKWETGGLNIDESRVETSDKYSYPNGAGGCKSGEFHYKGRAETPAENNLLGRFPSNLIWSHHPDCKKIGYKVVKSNSHYPLMDVNGFGKNYGGKTEYIAEGERLKTETVELWECVEGCPAKEFEKYGLHKSGKNCTRTEDGSFLEHGGLGKTGDIQTTYGDVGSPARFFKSCEFTEEDYAPFYYCAKASGSERNCGFEGGGGNTYNRKCLLCGKWQRKQKFSDEYTCHCESPKWEEPKGNIHPTVKPLAIMKYLIKLVTKEGQLVLDPFAGSGTTLIAAYQTNRKFIGFEKEKEYVEIANARLKPYLEQSKLT